MGIRTYIATLWDALRNLKVKRFLRVGEQSLSVKYAISVGVRTIYILWPGPGHLKHRNPQDNTVISCQVLPRSNHYRTKVLIPSNICLFS